MAESFWITHHITKPMPIKDIRNSKPSTETGSPNRTIAVYYKRFPDFNGLPVRDIVLVLATLSYIPLAFMNPGAGALCWVWFSIMAPHEQVYSFAQGMAFNSVIAGVTLVGWLASKERKHWTSDAMPWLLVIFTGWMTLNSVFAPFPDWSWRYWNRTVHMLVMAFLLFFVANKKARIQGTVWAVVIALGYYGLKGGVFTIMTGGNYIVLGPPGTILSDNNQLAAAIVMSIPLVNYLRLQTKSRWIQFGLGVVIALEIIMVLGSHSRGGVIALGVSLCVLWLTVRHKVAYGGATVVLIGVGLYLMPPEFWHRMNTLHNVDADASFQGRLEAWHVATYVAIDRFPFGAGFYAPQLHAIWDRYLLGTNNHAAHSIYFQVLGEHGFIGLGLYVFILVMALRNTNIILRLSRSRPDLAWAHDLAKMARVALIGFYVGGAALSMAYFDGLFVLIAICSTLRELVAQQTRPAPAVTAGGLRYTRHEALQLQDAELPASQGSRSQSRAW